jgi:hypothetical protein
VDVLAAAAFLFAVVALLAFHLRDRGRPGATSGVSLAFSLTCLVSYAVAFVLVARLEPFFGAPRNLIQNFLVVAIMTSAFHGVQYHLIVWHFHRRAYDDPEAPSRHGLAARLGSGLAAYLASGVVFSIPYGASVWWSTEWPSWTGALWAEERLVVWAVAVYWGLSLHHYYLDQVIWRPSRSPDLADHLGLAAACGPRPPFATVVTHGPSPL